ncbi:hypothetical protein HID58_085613 [Brassica napus]|uniref:Post-GPI attachment to proteins factor 3 n=1 Tax=Brassica napus TaxID=3708 RepID=A0ABQ7XQ15_BRANA|nr:hypothetical protein HID58_085613 [Brassica napus]
MVNSWEALYSGNYMKSKKANKKFESFKVFTETGLITDGTQQKFKIDDSDLKNKGGKPLLLEFLTLATHCMSGSMENTMDPASVTFSVLSLAMHFHGWLSFIITLYYKFPLKQDRTGYYEYVAVLGFSLIVSILRTFDVRVEAARVMVSAPLLALVTTHVLWNMIVCVAMGVAQLFLWARWAVSRHPSNWKLWVVVIASGLAMLLEIYDFPPYGGYFDVHSIWHLATVPLTILWWSFIRDDDEFRTSSLLKKSKTKAK